jgi:hypothetical protein
MNISRINYIILGLCLSTNTWSTIFYEADFEGPNKEGAIPITDPNGGGGLLYFLGGEIVGGKINPGDGTQDFQKFNNVILDSSPDARHSINGSNFALKTQYKAGQNPTTGERYQASFPLNTTIIGFPETDTLYARWHQKWGRSWVWPWDQQKLLKIKGPGSSQNFKVGSSHNYIYLTKRTPIGSANPDGLQNETSVFSKFPRYVTENDYRQEDSIPNNENFLLEKNRWYCIEVMVKSNTPDRTGALVDGIQDAEFRYWINNELKFELTGSSNRGNKTGGISQLELQHVLQRGSAPENQVNHDTPTWMDNIVVADQPIGCPEIPVASPAAPSNISVQ